MPRTDRKHYEKQAALLTNESSRKRDFEFSDSESAAVFPALSDSSDYFLSYPGRPPTLQKSIFSHLILEEKLENRRDQSSSFSPFSPVYRQVAH